MSADPKRVEAIFNAAVELPPADRAAFLSAECRDDAPLRQRVETLLAAHEELGDPGTAALPADPPTATFGGRAGPEDHTPGPDVGTVIAGKYKLMEEVGEGGMGTVWMAQQTEPVKRMVAVKLIKAGMDSRAVLARFEAERQALALMDHPNIARVLDAGATPDGRPFFVMELVKGVPITKFCDERRLTPRQRLELFVPVCQAIQHAHQKGVIHRDIKPSNVLVALYDDKPVPKVIDFGVAKATGQQLTELTINTGFGGVVGTPQYMSPEQASFNNLDIDTRSDVYSLGVLLYELLTGSPPFSKKELENKGLMEILRVVREEEPPRPSTKLSTADALPSLSANRGTEPRRLTALLRHELDWIVLKALEKDRTRRYETANGFAADVQRYLAGEPVQAVPPSTAYRLKKFLRRNKGPVLAGSLVLFALIAGIAGTTWGMLRATESAEAERLAKEDTDRKRVEAEQQHARAEKAEADLLADYRAATDDAIEQLINTRAELGPEETAYLQKALARWHAYAERQGDDERSRAIRGEGHFRVAFLWTKLNQLAKAEAEYLIARGIQQKLVEDFPNVPSHRHDLARTHFNLANMLSSLGKPKEQITEMQTALDIQQRLVDEHPTNPEYKNRLAVILNNFCDILERESPETALKHIRAALAIREELARQFPDDPKQKASVVMVIQNAGDALLALARPAEAWEEYQRSLALATQLAEQFPSNADYLVRVARLRDQCSFVLEQRGQLREALAEARTAQDLWQQSVKLSPTWSRNRGALAASYGRVGGLLRTLGEPDEALEEWRNEQTTYKTLVELFPRRPDYRQQQALSFGRLGMILSEQGRREESLVEIRLGLQVAEQLVEQYPGNRIFRSTLADLNNQMGRVLVELGQREEARPAFQAALDQRQRLARQYPTDKGYRVGVALLQARVGRYEEAVAAVEAMAKTTGWTADQRYQWACIYALAAAGSTTTKEEYADRAMTRLREAIDAGRKRFKLEYLKNDTDLDSLRGRKDFQDMLADLEGKAPQPTAPGANKPGPPFIAPPPREAKR